jgi:sulfite reductase (ferredoxin)
MKSGGVFGFGQSSVISNGLQDWSRFQNHRQSVIMMASKKDTEEQKDERPYARTLLDTNMDTDLEYKNTKIEDLKAESNYLRGNLIEEFDSEVNQNIPDLMMQLLKYHGSYQQNDREWKKNGWSEK